MDEARTGTKRRGRKKDTVRHEDRLETILKVAAHLFSEKGYDITSLDDIADAVDIHKATLYHYIESKEEILYLCLVRSFDSWNEVIKTLTTKGMSPLEKLRLFCSVLIEEQNNDFGRCLILVGRDRLGPETGERIRQFQHTLTAAARGVIEEGMKDGTFGECNPRLATAMLLGAFNWVPRWYRNQPDLTTSDICSAYLDIFVNGIAARQKKK